MQRAAQLMREKAPAPQPAPPLHHLACADASASGAVARVPADAHRLLVAAAAARVRARHQRHGAVPRPGGGRDQPSLFTLSAPPALTLAPHHHPRPSPVSGARMGAAAVGWSAVDGRSKSGHLEAGGATFARLSHRPASPRAHPRARCGRRRRARRRRARSTWRRSARSSAGTSARRRRRRRYCGTSRTSGLRADRHATLSCSTTPTPRPPRVFPLVSPPRQAGRRVSRWGRVADVRAKARAADAFVEAAHEGELVLSSTEAEVAGDDESAFSSQAAAVAAAPGPAPPPAPAAAPAAALAGRRSSGARTRGAAALASRSA